MLETFTHPLSPRQPPRLPLGLPIGLPLGLPIGLPLDLPIGLADILRQERLLQIAVRTFLRIVALPSLLALAPRLLLWLLLWLLLGLLFSPSSNAADFSQRTSLYMGGGYSFGKHSSGFYNPYYRTSDASRLFYASQRGLAQLGASWSGAWRIKRNNGLYLSASSSLLGGGGGGNLIDQDFCARGARIEFANPPDWQCPQGVTLWSESQHRTDNWFLRVEATSAIGFYLSRAKSRGRDFGLGLTLGYGYHNENDIAKGGGYNINLPSGITESNNLSYRFPDQSLSIIGNKVFWRYPRIGVEIWSEQVPARWQHPIKMKVVVNYIPLALFREEDSHFLRAYDPERNPEGDLTSTPNIISNGEGEGFQVQGIFSLPLRTGRRKAPHPELVLALEWQKLFLKKGSTVFLNSDGSVSVAYPLTFFTTENLSASLGINLVW